MLSSLMANKISSLEYRFPGLKLFVFIYFNLSPENEVTKLSCRALYTSPDVTEQHQPPEVS